MGNVVFNAHGGEHNREIVTVGNCGLADNLNRQFVVFHTGTGENRQLLAANQRGERVDRGNTGLNEVSRIFTGNRVNRRAVDVAFFHGVNRAQPVNRAAEAVKHSAEDFGRQRHFHGLAGEHGGGVFHGHAARALEHLHGDFFAVNFHHTAGAHGAVLQMQFDDFLVGGFFYAVQGDKGAVDTV